MFMNVQRKRLAHLIVLSVNQSKLELEFRWIDTENPWTALSVQAINTVSFHSSDVDGKIQCPDYAVIAAEEIRIRIFYIENQ